MNRLLTALAILVAALATALGSVVFSGQTGTAQAGFAPDVNRTVSIKGAVVEDVASICQVEGNVVVSCSTSVTVPVG